MYRRWPDKRAPVAVVCESGHERPAGGFDIVKANHSFLPKTKPKEKQMYRLTILLCLSAAVGCERQASQLQEPTPVGFDLTDTTYFQPIESWHDEGGLLIGGPNSSEEIRQTKSINGQTIEQLEKLMRPTPSGNDARTSKAGFLGEGESLLDILEADNDFVRSKRSTHRELAIPLLQITGKALKKLDPSESTIEFSHSGIRWRVDIKMFKGFQKSPFDDGTKTNMDFVVTNLDNQ